MPRRGPEAGDLHKNDNEEFYLEPFPVSNDP